MAETRRGVSVDLDGFLIDRQPRIQFGGLAAYAKFWSYNRPFVPRHEPITLEQRQFIYRPLSIFEEISFEIHSRRHIRPEVAEFVKQMQVDAIYANTGRPDLVQFRRLTRKQLHEGLLEEYIDDIFFKPLDVGSDESKYWGLVDLMQMGFTEVTHYDDNAMTIKRLAPLLPSVRFVIVEDLTSGILLTRREMRKHSNVAQIAIRKNGEIEVVHMPIDFDNLPIAV